jgi:hypothetical protein
MPDLSLRDQLHDCMMAIRDMAREIDMHADRAPMDRAEIRAKFQGIRDEVVSAEILVSTLDHATKGLET